VRELGIEELGDSGIEELRNLGIGGFMKMVINKGEKEGYHEI
jgi:hypothetical protein